MQHHATSRRPPENTDPFDWVFTAAGMEILRTHPARPERTRSASDGWAVLVASRHEDEAATLYLKELPRTEQFGDRKFPSPAAYYEAVAAETASSDSSERARHYAEAQRDWHMRGQTGCQFARLVAKDAEVMGWDYAVYDGTPQQVTPEIVVRLEDQVVDAIKRPETQVLSFLMPEVTEARDAVQIMRLLTENSAFWLERDEMTSDGQALYLRYPVKETQAWVMPFAPFDFLPTTRRGPLFELAIRVKEKPDWLYHRLNQDRDLAHLADVPLQLSDKLGLRRSVHHLAGLAEAH